MSRLSASPAASLAIVLRRAGATRKTSAFADQLEVAERVVVGRGLPGNAPRAGSRSNSSVRTGAPVSAANDAAPTNCWLGGRLDDAHGMPGLGREAHELERLVGGDPAADAERGAGP